MRTIILPMFIVKGILTGESKQKRPGRFRPGRSFNSEIADQPRSLLFPFSREPHQRFHVFIAGFPDDLVG